MIGENKKIIILTCEPGQFVKADLNKKIRRAAFISFSSIRDVDTEATGHSVVTVFTEN